MQTWKFLLIGVTGDLSKRKILPALLEFAYKNFQEVNIELIGYSRSIPDREEIYHILEQAVVDKKTNLTKINFIQGEYNDPSFFIKTFNELKEDERLIAYFAVPPHIFIDLLKIFCLVNKRNIDVIIEKPFGQDIEEARKIIKKVEDCNLQEIVHFCDHYLFKEGVNLTNEVLEKLSKFKLEDITTIQINALEKLDVNGRAGYFDKIGSIKDMIPAHFYSLWHILKKYNLVNQSFNDIVINSLKIGQYNGYKEDVANTESKTETYFNIDGSVEGIKVNLESGKKKSKKQTEILITYSNNSKIRWNIDPGKKIYIDETEFDLSHTNSQDHTNLLEDLKNKVNERFLDEQDAINGWLFYEKIKKYIDATNPQLEIY